MRELADAIFHRASALGVSIAVAESLTAGQVAAALVDTPGASGYFKGGVVAYDSLVKHELLGVDAGVLATQGAVSPEVATQMAEGVCSLLHADIGVATTGVAGPDPDEIGGHAPGLVFIAVAGTHLGTIVRELHLDGDREQIRQSATKAALQGLLDALDMVP